MKMLVKIVVTYFLLLTSYSSFSQEVVDKIKVKREDTYFKAEFDEPIIKLLL